MEQTGTPEWFALENKADLAVLDALSMMRTVVLFKHSRCCGLSSLVLERFRRAWQAATPRPVVYLLDLISYRKLSDAVSTRYAVEHESPQLLLIRAKACLESWSHGSIDFTRVQESTRA